jgi:hypothetical protein
VCCTITIPELLGHSFVDLTGATWDFYVREGQALNLRARGFEQDCYDQFFGEHTLNVLTPYAYCFASPPRPAATTTTTSWTRSTR